MTGLSYAAARQRLDLALVDLAARGGRPPCGEWRGHAVWTSDDQRVRAFAALRCRDECPLVTLCRAAADEAGELFGVWGGIDRGNRLAAAS